MATRKKTARRPAMTATEAKGVLDVKSAEVQEHGHVFCELQGTMRDAYDLSRRTMNVIASITGADVIEDPPRDGSVPLGSLPRLMEQSSEVRAYISRAHGALDDLVGALNSD